jgi:hypothetical protein
MKTDHCTYQEHTDVVNYKTKGENETPISLEIKIILVTRNTPRNWTRPEASLTSDYITQQSETKLKKRGWDLSTVVLRA